MSGIAAGETLPLYVRDAAVASLHKLGVKVLTYMRLHGSDSDSVYLQHITSGEAVVVDSVDTLVLCTGHVVPADALLLVHAAKDFGLTRVVVTHPALEGTTIPQMQEEASTGAFIELTSNQIIPVNQDGTDKIIPNPPSHQPSEYAGIIKAVGAEHIILSGDFGRPDYINFIPGWPMAIAALKNVGVTQAQIDIMAKKNPAHVLGMDDAKPAK